MPATELKRNRNDKANGGRRAEIRANKATKRLTSKFSPTVREFQLIRTLKCTENRVLNTFSSPYHSWSKKHRLLPNNSTFITTVPVVYTFMTTVPVVYTFITTVPVVHTFITTVPVVYTFITSVPVVYTLSLRHFSYSAPHTQANIAFRPCGNYYVFVTW